jgi:hypothetical protein
VVGRGGRGLGPGVVAPPPHPQIPNPQSPIPIKIIFFLNYILIKMFGNNKGGLFGNNQNQGVGLFGNNQAQNQGGLFGNNNQNQGGLFGNNNRNQGGLIGNNNQNQGGLFGNNNQNQGGLFGNNQNNQNQGGLFNGGNNNNNMINAPIQETRFFTTVEPVIALNKNNSIRNIPLSKLPDDYQKAVLTMKLNLKNQEIKLDELQRYSQRIIELIDQGNKSVEKMGEFNGFINKKLNQYESIVNQINDNFKFISEAFDQEQKNINLMEQDLGFKIDIPSKFLITYSQNLYNKTITFNQKLNDIITLIKVYYSQANDNINFDSGIMESTIAEFIKIVKSLLEENERQEKMINEMYHIILEFARNYGENPDTVRNNIIQYDSNLI